jgi:hypothetical protein
LALVLAHIEEIAAEGLLVASSGMSIIISVVFDGFVVSVVPDWGEAGDVAELFSWLAAKHQWKRSTIITSTVLWPPFLKFHRRPGNLWCRQLRSFKICELEHAHFEFTRQFLRPRRKLGRMAEDWHRTTSKRHRTQPEEIRRRDRRARPVFALGDDPVAWLLLLLLPPGHDVDL